VLRVDPRTGDRSVVSGCGDVDFDGILCNATIGQGPPFDFLQGIAVEADSHLVVTTVDKAVIRVHPRTGDRSIVSDAITGQGSAFQSPRGIAVEADGHLVVTDGEAVVRVDPRTGDRSIVSDATTGQGLAFHRIESIAVEADGHVVVVDDSSQSLVVRVDPATGDRSIFSDANIGQGPAFDRIESIAVEADGHLVVVNTAGAGFVGNILGQVGRVDPVSGDRTIIVQGSTTKGRGPSLGLSNATTKGIAVEADGHLVVADDFFGVGRVDACTGDRSIVSDATTGQGPAFELLQGLAVEADGHLVVAELFRGVVRVDPRTGDRSIVSDATTGQGPAFQSPGGLAVEADGHLVVVDAGVFGRSAVLRVDPRTGDRSVVSSCGDFLCNATIGQGPPFGQPISHSIAVEANGHLVVATDAVTGQLFPPPDPKVLRVDPRTGDRSIVSGVTIGRGSALQSAHSIALEADGHVVVVDGLLLAVIRVDPTTGDRTLVSR